MVLTWIHLQDLGMLKCTISSDLYYTTSNGGGTLTKHHDGEQTEVDGIDGWEKEKHWLSENFGDQFGVYEPQFGITEESWALDNPDYDGALPMFGLSPDGEYLDKLQRTARVQEGLDMTHIKVDHDSRIFVERDLEGNYWQRLWCEERSEFYNVQPCCVFPTNPGRRRLTTEEAQALLGE